MALDDYILVKDQDGNLKYFKDGKYFNIEEIERVTSNSQKSATVENKNQVVPKPMEKNQPLKPTRSLYDLDLKPDEDDEPKQFEHLEPVRKQLDESVGQTVATIVTDLKVNFTDEQTKRRFENLIASRLRDIRGDKELLYILTVPKNDGGMGLNDDRAKLVLAVIKKHLPSVKVPVIEPKKSDSVVQSGTLYEKQAPASMAKVDEQVSSPENFQKMRVQPPMVAKQQSVEKPLINKTVSAPSEVKPEITREMVDQLISGEKGDNIIGDLVAKKPVVQPISSSSAKELPINKPVAASEVKPEITKDVVDQIIAREKGDNIIGDLVAKKPAVQPVNPQPVRKSVLTNNLEQMSDVSAGPRLYSPTDELRTMDLENLHRLGPDIDKQLATIKEKIEILKEESWRRGLEGINAWRSSVVYELYYDIGVESIMSGKSVADIIVDRQIQNRPTLTPGEFDAILKFNKTLGI